MKGRSNSHLNKKAAVAHWLTLLLIVCILLALVFTLWLSGVRAGDSGMAPTILYGDVIIFDRLAKFLSTPQRGDIVAYHDQDSRAVLLGRVIALPGETVQVQDGSVYINGMLLQTDYLTEGGPDIPQFFVPQACFFLMPDARSSMEADYAQMLVPIERISGKAAMRVAPISRFGIFE